MAKKLLLGCALPLLIVGALIFFSVRSLLKASPKPERTETVQRGDVEIKVVETGTIEPLSKVEVKSKVGGRVNKLWVDAGARVQKGQILASIDPQEINSEVAALRAQLLGARAHLEMTQRNTIYQTAQTSTGIDQYMQNLAAAEARLRSAEAESNVQPQLTQQTIDMAQANLEAARATLKAQQDALNLMIQSTHPQNVVNTQSDYDQARAQSENAARNVERQKKLLAKGFVAQSVVDAAETDAQVAAAHLRGTAERLRRIQQTNDLEEANARSQVANAAGQVKQMESALMQAQSSVLPTTRRHDLENARAAYQQAKAQLASARSGKTQNLMRHDEAMEAQASVQQLQHQLDEALVRQRDTTLVASMTGIVTKRYVEPGELITSAISSFSSGTPVFQVADLSTMLIKININEVDIGKVVPGLFTEVTMDAARGVIFPGRVRKVAPAALSDTPSGSGDGSQSGSNNRSVIRFPVEIQIDHPDPRLKPGMSARCAIIVARKRNVLRLPTNCIAGAGSQATVQIVTKTVKDGQPAETTTPRQVVVGLRGDNFVEILSGLNEGEKVRPDPYNGPARKKIDLKFGD